MATFYLSSTFLDLKECREEVARTLRLMGHSVVGMEDYVAEGQVPLKKCLEDVAKCDAYLGIFAWRYGYIPKEGNPERKSITELEYREALRLKKEPLIFILRREASSLHSATSVGCQAAGERRALRHDLLTSASLPQTGREVGKA